MKNIPNSSTPPPSPSSKELNRIWKKQRNKYSIRTTAAALVNRKNSKNSRPPGRLNNYADDSDSETTATESHSKEDGNHHFLISISNEIRSFVFFLFYRYDSSSWYFTE